MDTIMNNLGSRIDKMELTVKKIAEQNFQILKPSVDNMNILINRFENNTKKDVDKEQPDKKGHKKRTRANTRIKGDIKGRELEDLMTSADNMKLMVVQAEDIMKSIQLSLSLGSCLVFCLFVVVLLSGCCLFLVY